MAKIITVSNAASAARNSRRKPHPRFVRKMAARSTFVTTSRRFGGTQSRDSVSDGPKSMWRYAAVLPDAEPVTLGEGFTPHAAQPQVSQPAD